MNLTILIIIIYFLIDDWLATQPKHRRRGPQPTLNNSKLLAIESVGSFLGHDTDKGLPLYFRRHYSHWFPALAQIQRITFVCQRANLWWVKVQMWRQLLHWLSYNPELFIMDSMPLPVCRFARANRCKHL